MDSHESRLDGCEHNQQKCWDEIDRLRKQMAIIDKQEYTQEDVKREGWDRDTDPRVVVVGAAQIAGKDEVLETLKEHARVSDIRPDLLRLEGTAGGIARNMVFHFDKDSPSP